MYDNYALIEVTASKLLKEQDNINIDNVIDCEVACGILKSMVEFKKTLTEQEETESAMLKQAVKRISAKYKPAKDTLAGAERFLRDKITRFASSYRQLALLRSVAKKTAEDDARLAQIEELEAEKANALNFDAVTAELYQEALNRKQEKIFAESGKADKVGLRNYYADFREHKTFEVADFSKIPAEFLHVDTKAIQAAIDSGVDVPGVQTKIQLIPVIK